MFTATTRNDKAMYVVLAATIVLGPVRPPCWRNVAGDGYDYRETVSPGSGRIFYFRPHPS